MVQNGDSDSPPGSDCFVPERHFKYSKIVFKMGSCLQACPYKWDTGSESPKIQNSGLGLAMWRVNTALQLGFKGFLVGRLIQAVAQKRPVTDIALLVLLTSFGVPALVCEMTLILHWTEILGFLGRTLKLYRHFGSQFMKNAERRPKAVKMWEMLYLGFCANILQFGSCLVMLGATFPTASAFPSSLLWELGYGKQINGSWWALVAIRIANATFAGYIAFLTVCETSVVVLAIMTFILISPSIISELGKQTVMQMGASGQNTVLEAYIHLEYLFREFATIFGSHFGVVQFLVMCMAVGGAYCAVRIGGLVGQVSGMFGASIFMVVVVVWSFSAEAHRKSSILLRDWKANPGRKYAVHKRIMLTLHSLRVQIAGFFFIDKMLVLTIGKITFDAIANILILTRDKRQ